jgi:hypothetical protein
LLLAEWLLMKWALMEVLVHPAPLHLALLPWSVLLLDPTHPELVALLL